MNTIPMSPTQPQDRIESIDVLRGVVLLGILVVNITGFALPQAWSFNPTQYGIFEGWDVFAYWATFFVFEGSQRAIFSMLFGAGIVIFTQRLSADERGSNVGGIFTRRMLVLMLFGLVDMFLLLWFGDIIFVYALVGLLLFFFREASVRGLLIASGVLFLLLTLYLGLSSVLLNVVEQEASRAMDKLEAGEPLNQFQELTLDEWRNMSAQYQPETEAIQTEVEHRSGGYLAAYPEILPLLFEYQVTATLAFILWDVMLMMLIGMALFKLGLLDGSKTYTYYLTMMGIGFGLGLTINALELHSVIRDDYDALSLQLNWTYNLGRLLVALGFIGLVMLICKAGILGGTRKYLAAVGRMALTNYLVQSLICLLVFVVLGYFGQLRYHQLFFFVFAIWAVQLIYSSLWLQHFRFGPLEWLWRRLTYLKSPSRRS